MIDTVLQRKNMVESQIRPSDVTDRRITSAMLDIPRERFVPKDAASLAYMDSALVVAQGRSLLAPRDFARLVQLAQIEASDKVLIVGGLGGYSSAVIARMAATVVAVEADKAVSAEAAKTLKALSIANVSCVAGDLVSGCAVSAPYDVIVIEGGVEIVPDALLAQLADRGRLVAVEFEQGVGRAVIRQKSGETLSRRAVFEASAPLLPGFARANAFAF